MNEIKNVDQTIKNLCGHIDALIASDKIHNHDIAELTNALAALITARANVEEPITCQH